MRRYVAKSQNRPACTEVPCPDCGVMIRYVVSDDALGFYFAMYPGQPYRCPTHRRQHQPGAALYAQVPRVEARP